ncbi:hypothetical protein ACLB2K_031339 [Fragaria x ananassa]
MEAAIGRKRKERTHASEAGEENCTQRKKTMQTTPGRKRKERKHTLEEEENCRQTKIDKAKIDVSFSKRRRGLFGKAARLCKDFDDTRLAVLVVSKAGRSYAFGHSSVNEVLNDIYHIQPTTTKSAEGLNLMRQLHEKKKVMGVKEEIENEMMACQTVEGLASLREKYLKIDEEINKKLRYCSSKETSFEGGVMDQKYNIGIVNVGDDGRLIGSGYESSYTDLLSAGGLRLEGDTDGKGCCVGLGQRDATTGIISNPLLASSESNYGVHDGGLTINGTFDGDGYCSLGLCHDVGNTSLRDPITTGISDNFWLELGLGLGHEVSGNSSRDLTTGISGNSLCLTTSNYGVDHGVGGGLRVNGHTDAQGCPLGLGLEVGNTSLSDPTTGINDNFWLELGLGHEASGNSSRDLSTGISGNSLCSTTSNYGVDHGVGGGLRLNGDTDAQGCPLGLCHDVGNASLKDPTSGISDNFLLELGLELGLEVSGDSSRGLTTGISGNSLCSTTSNNGLVDHGVGGVD